MTADWTYGEEGKAFPVEPGQVWRVTDRHIYVCSDFMESQQFDEWVAKTPPTLMYTDPPWGQALVNGFRTKAGKPRAMYTWQDLYRRVAAWGHQYRIPIWAEASVETHRDGAEVPFTLMAESHPHRGYVQIEYSGHKPCGLFYAGMEPVDLDLLGRLKGVYDGETPGIVMDHYEPGTVIDPCGGRGTTARRGEERGWRSITNEMNPHRMSAAMFRMGRDIDADPEQIA